jgi:hypothetical protein
MDRSKLCKQLLLALALVVLGVLSRTIFHLGANVEIVTSISFFAAWVISDKKLAFLVPILIIITSDFFIGNSNILLFTWSGFAITAIISWWSSKQVANSEKHKHYLLYFGSGIFSIIIFYLWSNLGVVILSEMYSQDISGLLKSYINALPFLRNQLLSGVIGLNFSFLLMWFMNKYFAQKYISFNKRVNFK